FFFSSRRRHTRFSRDWSSDVCSSDLPLANLDARARIDRAAQAIGVPILVGGLLHGPGERQLQNVGIVWEPGRGPTHTYVKQHPEIGRASCREKGEKSVGVGTWTEKRT